MTQPTPPAGLRYGPVVEHLAVSVYRVPTDLPGGDATLTWVSWIAPSAREIPNAKGAVGRHHGHPRRRPPRHRPAHPAPPRTRPN
ncbi:hypothetical protein JTP67_15025 [Streptomyces sp. S12]|nr:hypothetical protein [Streptomyces sp. S12]